MSKKINAVKEPKALKVKIPKVPKEPESFKCKLCEEKTVDYIMYKGLRYHPECAKKKEQLEIDQVEWLELCEYVAKHILGYTEGKEKFPKHIILRLRGLREGKFKGNNKMPKYADYSFKMILYTFKAKKLDILSACGRIDFKDEVHRFNVIMRIVEDNINDIIRRFKKIDETNEKFDNLEIIDLQLPDSEPKESIIQEPKQNKMAEKFKNLW